MVKRRERDIYGNWVWTDDNLNERKDEAKSKSIQRKEEKKFPNDEQINLDWRDYVALTIASLETFLLPIVIFIIVLVGLVLILPLLR